MAISHLKQEQPSDRGSTGVDCHNRAWSIPSPRQAYARYLYSMKLSYPVPLCDPDHPLSICLLVSYCGGRLFVFHSFRVIVCPGS